MSRVLLIDSDPAPLAHLTSSLQTAGHQSVTCESASAASSLIRGQQFDLILCDGGPTGREPLSLLASLKMLGLTTPLVTMAEPHGLQGAAMATRFGAMDYLQKPVTTEKLLLTLDSAVRITSLEEENRRLRHRNGKLELVWASPRMQSLVANIDRVAPSETRVCITGETGAGRELVARTIHDKSSRAKAPFVAMNIQAVPIDQIESELYGHEKPGGKTIGKVEQAQGGTLFLDGINDLPRTFQARLARLLDDRQITRVGSEEIIEVDFRLIAGSTEDLYDLTERGQFREDLLHRIAAFPLAIPPLRDRLDDIPLLTDYFARVISQQNDWKPRIFAADAYSELQRYEWPGNVRELRTVVERLLLLSEDTIDAALVRRTIPSVPEAASAPVVLLGSGSLSSRVEAFEREAILSELRRHDYRMADAARALSIERSHLYKKCQQLGIDHKAIRG